MQVPKCIVKYILGQLGIRDKRQYSQQQSHALVQTFWVSMSISVTRFVKNLHHFGKVRNVPGNFSGFFHVWHNFKSTFANLCAIGQILFAFNGQILNKVSSHLVKLLETISVNNLKTNQAGFFSNFSLHLNSKNMKKS